MTTVNAIHRLFLGSAPDWYKVTVVGLLAVNPLLLWGAGPTVTAWAILFEFIFMLAFTLKCYPLQPGGLLALEALILGLTTTQQAYAELAVGFPIILLLTFMVAGVYFLKDMLLFVFTHLLLGVRSRVALSLMFCFSSAVLSAFLDALTVMAVVLAVGAGFYGVYHRAATGRREEDEHDVADDTRVPATQREDLERFRAFLRGLLMHSAVGTTLGGVATLVGEPQNVLIGARAGWDFMEFFYTVAPVSLPVFVVGLITCALVERLRLFGYGVQMPPRVADVLTRFAQQERARRDQIARARIAVQALVAILMLVALATHVAEVGLIGLGVIVLATALTGVVEEHRLGEAFHVALPFTALLGVFFVIVAMIHTQHLFSPVLHWVLTLDGRMQVAMFYASTGALSAISDNVFVASLFIEDVVQALRDGAIDADQFRRLMVALNAGTNIPSIATPNGQAAFLFVLSSALAPLVRLSYGRMVWMALPYFIFMSAAGIAAVVYLE